MAIYKPSNCVPFSNAIDPRTDQFVYCELNTSNTKVTGYKLRVLNSKNETILDNDSFTELPDGQSGLNGSLLKLPLIYTENGTNNTNAIFYNGTNKSWYNEKNNEELPKFNPNNIYQPYKWQVVLAQGQTVENGKLKEPVDKYYDIKVASGKIIGSTAERIQSYLSEYIYKDYYIQLYNVNNDIINNIGNRARISSYDHTFGYLYPQEGSFSENMVSGATDFSVFKDTNSLSDVSVARTVQYVSFVDMAAVGTYESDIPGQKPVPPEIKLNTTTNSIIVTVRGDKLLTLSDYVRGVESNTPIVEGVSILFTGCGNGIYDDGYLEAEPTINDATYNKFNGVFNFVKSEPSKDGLSIIYTWQRPLNFSQFANYIDRSVFVSSTQTNYVSTAKADIGGTINETPLRFFEEQPIGLYLERDENGVVATKTIYVDLTGSSPWFGKVDGVNIANISVTGVTGGESGDIKVTPVGGSWYKLEKIGSSAATKATLEYSGLVSRAPILKTDFHNKIAYVAPNVNIKNEMKLFYGDQFNKNIKITSVDNTVGAVNNYTAPTWQIKWEDNTSESFSVGDYYEIRSYFKESDENPFYIYDAPTLTIKYLNNELVDGTPVKTRALAVLGDYEQAQNRSWKSYKWMLEDLKNGWITETETEYDGEIAHTFYGMENGHPYEITLTVEDEFGNFYNKTATFSVVLKEGEYEATYATEFDCDTYSTKIISNTSNSVAPPTINKGGKYDIDIENKVMKISKETEVIYENLTYGESVLPIPSIFPADNPTDGSVKALGLYSKHNLESGFIGDVIKYEVTPILQDGEAVYISVRTTLPDILSPTLITLGGKELNEVNPHRNKIWYEIKAREKNVIAGTYNLRGQGDIELDGWQETLPAVSTYTVKSETSEQAPYDFIDSDIYDLKDSSFDGGIYLNIREGYNHGVNSNSEIHNIIETTQATHTGSEKCWTNYKFYYDERKNENVWKLKDSHIEEWVWDNNGFWFNNEPAGTEYTAVVKVENKTGRENVQNYDFQFEVTAENYASIGNYVEKCIVTAKEGN